MDPTPVYTEKDTSPVTTTALPAATCTHLPTSTPHLTAQLTDPQTRARLLALTTALTAATEEGACLTCSGETIKQTLAALAQDTRAAKQEGRWSCREKRALKGEVKGLLRG